MLAGSVGMRVRGVNRELDSGLSTADRNVCLYNKPRNGQELVGADIPVSPGNSDTPQTLRHLERVARDADLRGSGRNLDVRQVAVVARLQSRGKRLVERCRLAGWQ